MDVSPESLARTSLGQLEVGSKVNMERALRLADRLGGHLVSGHVDTLGRVEERKAAGDFTLFTFTLDSDLSKYIIKKGSITIDGVSLTVNFCSGNRFSVSIIPHTLAVTTLGNLRQGSRVNLEVDIIGKYVEQLLSAQPSGASTEESKINPAFLAEHGFLR